MSTGEQAPAGDEGRVVPTAATSSETGITAGPAQGIDLPPMPAPTLSPAANPERGRSLDGILRLLLLVFAFLTASFKAYNSDLFLHLASGRLLAEGKYTFGTDPFSFASQGTWVNHSWLFDLLTYALYQLDPAGVVLIAAKALLVVGVAWVMLAAARVPGQRLWLPICCTTLGVLTMSPRVWLQPTVFSMFLLAVFFLVLARSADRPRRLWLLPLLSVLWVNLDAWFFLGPLTVLAYLLGQFVDSPRRETVSTEQPGPASGALSPLRTLALVFVACLAACLCNPHHALVFTRLPIGVVNLGGLQTFAADPSLRGFFLSPILDYRLYFYDTVGLSVAGIAYFVLLAVSLASFAILAFVALPTLRWDRLMVWVVFAVLSAYHMRAIPYFAVVAAPITALNFADLLARLAQSGAGPGASIWAIPGRVLTMLVLLGLCVGSISGAIQSSPHYRREVGWGIAPDRGLAEATRQIAAWGEGRVIAPGQNWMTLSPETVNYLAWFAPGEKGFIDQRLSLFTGSAEEYVTLRRSLAGEQAQDPAEPAQPAWRQIFRDRGVQFLLFHSPDVGRASGVLVRLYGNVDEFVPCFVAGNAVIFAWRDPENRSAPAVDPRLVLNFDAKAFGPQPEVAPREAGREPGTLPWWWPVLRAAAPTPADTALAQQQSIRFDALSLRYRYQSELAWLAMNGSSLAGLASAPGGPLAGGILLPLRFNSSYDQMLRKQIKTPATLDQIARLWTGNAVRLQDSGPPSAPYLGIRAARRSLLANPDDPITFLILAQSYTTLTRRTQESRFTQPSPGQAAPELVTHARFIRQTQIVAALRNVLKVSTRPEREQAAHWLLMEAFADPEYLEPRVRHMREVLRLAGELRSFPLSSPSTFEQDQKRFEAQFKEIERQLKSKRDQYVVNAAKKRQLMEKVRIALQGGLAETALDLLLKASPEELQAEPNAQDLSGATLALYLLLGLGRVEEADQALTPDPKSEKPFDPRAFGTHPLGLPAYEWFQVQKSAAMGDYAAADHYLAKAIEWVRQSPRNARALEELDVVPEKFFKKDIDRATVAAALVGQMMLHEAARATRLPWQLGQLVTVRPDLKMLRFRYPALLLFDATRSILLPGLAQEADLWTVRAWLALEAGATADARTYARRALDLGGLGGADQQYGLMFPGRGLAKLVLKLTQSGSLKD